jgi:phospholipid/cholesterol/gamma-HCH transport system substrate-binding protein
LNFSAGTFIIAYREDSNIDIPKFDYEYLLSMKKKSSELKVGLLTLVAILVLVGGTLFVGNFHWFQKTKILNVYFDVVSGLQEGSPVQLNGVRVGEVKSITMHPEMTHPIIVALELLQSAKIHKDAEVSINTQGLMGEKYVEIYAGTLQSPYLYPGEPLMGQSPTGLEDVLKTSKQVADNLEKTTKAFADIFTQESTKNAIRNFMVRLDDVSKNIDDLVAQRRGDISQFAINLRVLSDNMKGVVNEMDTMLKENSGNINKISSNLAEVSENIRAHSAKITENIDALTEQLRGTATEGRPDLQTTLKNFRDASEEFKKSMEKLDTIAGRIQNGEGTVGKLVSSDALYDQASSTMSSVRNMASTISAGGKFFGGIQFEYEMRYRGELDRFRNDIDARITPNDEKYYIIGVSDVGETNGLNLLYVRREGPLDIKMGIWESKSSAQLAYNMFKDRLSLEVLGVGLTGKTRVDVQSYLLLGKYWDVNWYAVVGGDDLTREPTASAGFQMRY